MGTLDGKVAAITGSSRGIGKNIALELAAEGCNIIIAARTEEVKDPRLPGTIYSAAEECRALGVEALPVAVDVTRDETLEEMVEKGNAEFGHIDILVNNAALNFPGRFLDMEVRRWDLLWRLNVRGTIVATRLVLPGMIERKWGTIINISSGGADSRGGGGAAYSVTKQAVRKLADAVAADYGDDGVQSFSLSPGNVVSTPGHRYIRGDNAVAHDLAEPDHVMGRAAVWLCSEAAKTFNGQHFFSIPVVAQRLYENTTWGGLAEVREKQGHPVPASAG